MTDYFNENLQQREDIDFLNITALLMSVNIWLSGKDIFNKKNKSSLFKLMSLSWKSLDRNNYNQGNMDVEEDDPELYSE